MRGVRLLWALRGPLKHRGTAPGCNKDSNFSRWAGGSSLNGKLKAPLSACLGILFFFYLLGSTRAVAARREMHSPGCSKSIWAAVCGQKAAGCRRRASRSDAFRPTGPPNLPARSRFSGWQEVKGAKEQPLYQNEVPRTSQKFRFFCQLEGIYRLPQLHSNRCPCWAKRNSMNPLKLLNTDLWLISANMKTQRWGAFVFGTNLVMRLGANRNRVGGASRAEGSKFIPRSGNTWLL